MTRPCSGSCEVAAQRGANAVLAMRFDSNEVGSGYQELVAYGTAVVVVPADQPATAGQPAPAFQQPAAATAASPRPAGPATCPAVVPGADDLRAGLPCR